ncbi:membrane protein US8A [Equid alphaherpesvirus 4]|uniref:Membrane protein US8A n=1 Tax=Equid alphaherpesvirus 4 TaxID=10331 RepID=O55526_9ALPH|nr:membrane protein US8A [Equid alphaherpesvirus 4]AMB16036.1 membrane protein US8A [Equid alphaherpesvirus 4]AMB16115.1 membrane protein US8A [Equid alphaherpesvirus 4]AMB16194.1 membrane protein US8A [Equid alphaherpesvirus 4]AMB16273.1 membrane protein US8A [Equid alphaherpesvirus 4]
MNFNNKDTACAGNVCYAEGLRNRKSSPVRNSTFEEYLDSLNNYDRRLRADSTSDSDSECKTPSEDDSNIKEFTKIMDLKPPSPEPEPAAAEEPVSTAVYILNEWVAPMLGHFLAMYVYDLLFN